MRRGDGSGCRPEKEPMVGQRALVVERNSKIGELISGHHPRRPATTDVLRRWSTWLILRRALWIMYAKRSFLKKLDEILAQKEELTEPVEAILGGNK